MLDLLLDRRSIRKYDRDRIVSDEIIDRIIEAGRIAPSACNKQPWHFYLVKSDEAKKKVWACYDREWIRDAAAFVIIVGEVDECWTYTDGYGDTSLYTDCAIATTHMMLQATAEGVGSLWVCNFDRPKCCELFGLDMEHHRPISILTLGYPTGDAGVRPFKRKNTEEILTIL